MTQKSDVQVKVNNDGLVVSTEGLRSWSELSQVEWQASQLNDRKIILRPIEDAKASSGMQNGFAWTPIDIFADLLLGMIQRRWSGVISIDTTYGFKKLFMKDGEVCFASSNVIDDRLGEVVYRDGLISLDQMVSAAVKVDRSTKFGQVLLQNQIVSGVELWQALQLQVQEILRSIFLVDSVYYEIRQGRGLSATEVVFPRGSEELIEECLSYGKMFKNFAKSVTDDTQIFVNDDAVQKNLKSGTFMHDFMMLARDSSTLSALINSSKLRSISTKAALMNAVNLGLCVLKTDESLVGDVEVGIEGLGELRSKIDTFEVILKRAKDEFLAAGVEFPLETLRTFAEASNPIGFLSLVLDQEGQIGKVSLQNIYSQCQGNLKRARFFEIRVESLIQFLLQISGDLLKQEYVANIKSAYRNLIE